MFSVNRENGMDGECLIDAVHVYNHHQMILLGSWKAMNFLTIISRCTI